MVNALILNEREMKMARSLARDLVRVQKEKERMYRLEQRQSLEKSFESLGRAIKIAQDAVIEGYVKPFLRIRESIIRGFNQ